MHWLLDTAKVIPVLCEPNYLAINDKTFVECEKRGRGEEGGGLPRGADRGVARIAGHLRVSLGGLHTEMVTRQPCYYGVKRSLMTTEHNRNENLEPLLLLTFLKVDHSA